MMATITVATEYLKLQGEFGAMPGLCLTVKQVARLLDIDRKSAADVLRQLEADGVLMRTSSGLYRTAVPLMS
jgi:predicted transcriptional regulator of viral defense system